LKEADKVKFITFRLPSGEPKSGWLYNEQFAIDMNGLSNGELPCTLIELIEKYHEFKSLITKWGIVDTNHKSVYKVSEVELLSPLPVPISIRDFYAFEEHVKTARERRGLSMVPQWYDNPVFYFTNHLAVIGQNSHVVFPLETKEMDFELEIACVIGKKGRDIQVENALSHVFGFCIMNDWSARDIQREEMKVGLGPSKGKDFATSLGPYLVSIDELNDIQQDHHFHLHMTASVNDKQLSQGNVKDLYYSFSEMIAHASKGVCLYPGEILGSGTVGSGCILELGAQKHPWLKKGDKVALKIDRLGTLINTIK